MKRYNGLDIKGVDDAPRGLLGRLLAICALETEIAERRQRQQAAHAEADRKAGRRGR